MKWIDIVMIACTILFLVAITLSILALSNGQKYAPFAILFLMIVYSYVGYYLIEK